MMSSDERYVRRQILAELEPVYRATAPLVMRLAAYHALDPEDAADVVSQTFVLALERWDRFDPSLGSPTGWILGIANNVLRQHAAAGARQRRLFERSVFQRPPLTVGDVAEYAELRADTRELLRAIADLPSSERSLLLARLGDTSYAELEQAHGGAAGALRQRVLRTTANLRAAVSAKGE